MITLFALKQNKCFRVWYKSRPLIKNIFLIAVLVFFLFVMDVIYFRADGGGNIKSASNILKGLNSNTFNFLQANSQSNLALDLALKKFNIHQENVTS